jgi:hypothetical protein
LGDLFAGRTPKPIALFVSAMQLASIPQVRWLLKEAFPAGEQPRPKAAVNSPTKENWPRINTH